MSETTECAVAIVGGGPTGMMLAAELTLAGVDAMVLERRPNHELDGSRAGGLHSRTIELLDQRGRRRYAAIERRRFAVGGLVGVGLGLGVGAARVRHHLGSVLQFYSAGPHIRA